MPGKTLGKGGGGESISGREHFLSIDKVWVRPLARPQGQGVLLGDSWYKGRGCSPMERWGSALGAEAAPSYTLSSVANLRFRKNTKWEERNYKS